MSYENKLKAAHAELNKAGIRESSSNPIYIRILRKLGFQSPPPFYRSFWINWLTSYIFFTFIYGTLMWFISWQDMEFSILQSFVSASTIGGIFGFAIANYYKWKSSRCKLSKWEKLG
ncbi:MAG: hypothetical protein ACI9ES_003156 [Oceanospirillaceae bacterium]|jgi:hypothetical protein